MGLLMATLSISCALSLICPTVLSKYLTDRIFISFDNCLSDHQNAAELSKLWRIFVDRMDEDVRDIKFSGYGDKSHKRRESAR
jgi:hypothetical protein